MQVPHKKAERMKSIKEKAEEYSFIRQGINPAGIQYRDFNINKQDAFMAGANYVLEQIESLPNKTIDVYNLIEQLKSNQ